MLFSKRLKVSWKKYKRNFFFSRKIWNCHECFICENEKFENKLIIQQTCVEVAKVLWYLVIWPPWNQKISYCGKITKCYRAPLVVTQLEAWSEISTTVSTPKCPHRAQFSYTFEGGRNCDLGGGILIFPPGSQWCSQWCSQCILQVPTSSQ